MLADISDQCTDNAAAIQADGGKAEFVRLDVSDSESWKAAVAATPAALGWLTSLSNCHGTTHYARHLQELIQGWTTIIALKQTAVPFVMQAAPSSPTDQGNS